MIKISKRHKKPLRPFREHQIPAFAYAMGERHPVLFMEMRLGKTVVAIRTIKTYEPQDRSVGLRVLIVGPSSVLPGWEKELRLEREKDIVYLMGTRQQRLDLLLEKHKWNLINREGWRALPEIAPEEAEADEADWDAVVIDESTSIRNPKAKITRFFTKKFRDIPHRWALSGLPNPESDLDFFTQLEWAGHGFPSSDYWSFRSSLFVPTITGWEAIDQEVIDNIRGLVGERCFVMKRDDAGVEVGKVYEQRFVDLPTELRDTYDDLEKNFILEYRSTSKTTNEAIVKYTWCRRMCGGVVSNEWVWDGKLKELHYLIENELRGQSLVVWFAYNLELQKVLASLRASGYTCAALVGGMPPERRHYVQERFNARKIQVVCAQIKALTHGATFSGADAAVYYSSSPSNEERTQTEDRIVDVMQSAPQLYIDLVVPETVDEDISNMLHKKRAISRRALREAVAARRGL